MYKLFIGFRKLGEFPTILEAKRFARDSGLSGVFSLVGENYRDSWYISESQPKSALKVTPKDKDGP